MKMENADKTLMGSKNVMATLSDRFYTNSAMPSSAKSGSLNTGYDKQLAAYERDIRQHIQIE